LTLLVDEKGYAGGGSWWFWLGLLLQALFRNDIWFSGCKAGGFGIVSCSKEDAFLSKGQTLIGLGVSAPELWLT
jgi:hypothetical protein